MAVAGELRPSTRTLGRYELIASIGTGGMAEVHLARQRGPMGFEKLVVVKTVHGHLAAQRDFIEMLLEEARIAALVKHANVVDIYDLGVVDGSYFIAMEYLEGEPLLAILRAGKQGKRLDPLSMTRLIADCAEGLHAAHELHAMSGQPLSVVHHDVSPGNVMVLYSGEIKLVDFGVAKAENRVEQAGERVLMKGKMSYMAPEKLRGASGDRRSDVFSLGVVLWEALTLRRLFRADSDKEVARMIIESTVPPPSTLDPSAPPELDAVVARALAKDCEQRYPTAKAMAAALEDLLRKNSYSGKNDKIGEYMHSTFGDRLASRRDLIRSMSGPGVAPSPQAIAHAFRTDRSLTLPLPSPAARAAVATLPPAPPRPPPVPPAIPSGANARAMTEELSTFTEVDAYKEPTDLRKWIIDDARTVLDDAMPEMEGTPSPAPVPPARRDAVVIGAVIALGLVVAIIGFVLTRGNPDSATAVAPAADTDEPAVAALPAPEPEPESAGGPVIGDLGGPSRHDTAPAAKPDKGQVNKIDKATPDHKDRTDRDRPDGRGKPDNKSGKGDDKSGKGDRTGKPPEDKTGKPPDDKTGKPPEDKTGKPPEDKTGKPPDDKTGKPPEDGAAAAPTGSSAGALVKEGSRHFVAGKLKEALASFELAKNRAPGFAPAYRGIGMVKQRLGDMRGAIAAFRKYLQLAPRAGDAESIQGRLEKLEKL